MKTADPLPFRRMHSWDHPLLSSGWWWFIDARGPPGGAQVALHLGRTLSVKMGTLRPAPACLVDPGRIRGGRRGTQALPDPRLLCGLCHLRSGLRPHHRRLPLLQVGPVEGGQEKAGKENFHSGPLSRDSATMETHPRDWLELPQNACVVAGRSPGRCSPLTPEGCVSSDLWYLADMTLTDFVICQH